MLTSPLDLALSARAAEVNVNAAALEDARDGHDPKAEIIALIISSQAATSPRIATQGP
jgi:hypothetical protein